MKTVFLSDVSVAWSKSGAASEATFARALLASRTFSPLLLFKPMAALLTLWVAAGAGLSDTEPVAAHTLEYTPPVTERCWTMVLRRLSSPSISFLTKQRVNFQCCTQGSCRPPLIFYWSRLLRSTFIHLYVVISISRAILAFRSSWYSRSSRAIFSLVTFNSCLIASMHSCGSGIDGFWVFLGSDEQCIVSVTCNSSSFFLYFSTASRIWTSKYSFLVFSASSSGSLLRIYGTICTHRAKK